MTRFLVFGVKIGPRVFTSLVLSVKAWRHRLSLGVLASRLWTSLEGSPVFPVPWEEALRLPVVKAHTSSPAAPFELVPGAGAALHSSAALVPGQGGGTDLAAGPAMPCPSREQPASAT